MPASPKDAPLWDVVKRATYDALHKVAIWIQENSTTSDLVGRRDTWPNWEQLFGVRTESDILAVYQYVEISEISDLMDIIDVRPVVREKFAIPVPNPDGTEGDTKIMRHEVAMIPLTLAENYVALYGQTTADDDKLVKLYEPYESYLLGENEKDLRANITVPILGANLEQAGQVDGNSIIRIDSRWNPIFTNVAADGYDLETMRKAKVSLRMANATVRVEGFGSLHYAYPSQESDDAIARFFEALAIEAPGPTTWVQVAIEPCNWSAKFNRSGGSTTVTLRRDFATRIDAVYRRGLYDPYNLNDDQSNLILADQELLKHSNKSIRVAARRLARARCRPDGDDRIIDLCIGLEALLGSGFSETVHRLSMRAAVLLSKLWGISSAEVYKATRDLYALRSRVVHGDTKPYGETMLNLDGVPIHASRFATAALASLLKRLIGDEEFDPARPTVYLYCI